MQMVSLQYVSVGNLFSERPYENNFFAIMCQFTSMWLKGPQLSAIAFTFHVFF